MRQDDNRRESPNPSLVSDDWLDNETTPTLQEARADCKAKKGTLQRQRRRIPPVLTAVILLGLGYLLMSRFGFRMKSHEDHFHDGSNDNHFVTHFRHVLGSNNLTSPAGKAPFVPLVLRDGRLLCRRAHKRQMENPKNTLKRARAAVEMIQASLGKFDAHKNASHALRFGLPILLMNGDQNGCHNRGRDDRLGYPRLAWSQPSPKYGTDWCRAVPIPSYESWVSFHKRYPNSSSWDSTFASQSNRYPWPSKTRKAVWRGTTTYYQSFTGRGLNETPRGRLVQKSMENTELIDAGFVNIIQQYASRKEELSHQTILTERIPMNDFMKHRAILDIDGNNWSSRFPKLMCMNSVVIKVDPEYTEYFYHELKPMVHYVPASLENVTQVAEYVLDKENEAEMKDIIHSANSWCKGTMNDRQMTKDMMVQLEKYKTAFDEYMRGNVYDESTTPLVPDDMSDNLVDCYW